MQARDRRIRIVWHEVKVCTATPREVTTDEFPNTYFCTKTGYGALKNATEKMKTPVGLSIRQGVLSAYQTTGSFHTFSNAFNLLPDQHASSISAHHRLPYP